AASSTSSASRQALPRTTASEGHSQSRRASPARPSSASSRRASSRARLASAVGKGRARERMGGILPDRGDGGQATGAAMSDIEGVVETGIYADDLEQAEAFYHEVLGLPVLAREAGRHVFFQAGPRGVLLVFNPQATLTGDVLPAHGARGPGHFALGV